MKNSLHNINLKELSDADFGKAGKDFYLSPDDILIRYYSVADSFIFNGFVISLVKTGHNILKINGVSHTVADNDIVFIGPNNLIEFERIDTRREKLSIIVSTEFIIGLPSPADAEVMDICSRRPVIHLGQEQMARLARYYSFLSENCFLPQNRYRTEISRAGLYAMILEICEFHKENRDEADTEKSLQHNRLYDDFFMLLTRYYRRERSVAFYADKMNLTPKYLSRAIKKVSGKSILEWINEFVIIEIKVRLKTTEKTILEISEDLNFPNPSAFIQFFKLHTGMTPLKFRKSK